MSANPAPKSDDRLSGGFIYPGLIVALMLTACKSEPESGGLSGVPAQPATQSEAPLLSEPPVPVTPDRGARNQFETGRRLVLARDFGRARPFFEDALRRHESRGGAATDAFSLACVYYFGRVQEGMLEFDAARSFYERIPAESAIRPYALQRLLALSRDSDNDGYMDAWEEAEGSNPNNPLSHP